MTEKLFGNLKVSRKLTLICATFFLPIGVLLYSTITTIYKDVDFARYEMYGNRYQRPLEKLLEIVPESMELARRFLTTDKQDKEALAAKQGETDRAFDELDLVDQAIGALLQLPRSPVRPFMWHFLRARGHGLDGKGFAIVASEVKELANETGRATEDIGRKIAAIQSDTKGSIDAITRIGAVISQISDIQNTIASAVEEQAATTNEIGRNVSEAAKGSADIAQNITGVARAADDTSGGAANIQALADNLARMAVDLQKLVAQFKVESRHA